MDFGVCHKAALLLTLAMKLGLYYKPEDKHLISGTASRF